MPVLSARWKIAVVGVIVYAAFTWYFGGDVPGERKAAAQEKKYPISVPRKGESDATPIYFGVESCSKAGCHGDPKPRPFNPKDPAVCKCNEATIWTKNDKHFDAYNVIDTSNPMNPKAKRARQMQAILAEGDPSYKVYEDPHCLACHALVVDKTVKANRSFKINEGVNCVVCHGAYLEWVEEHPTTSLRHDDFMKLSRSEKQKKKGMIDLWDSSKRAQLCAACHIGNQKEGKFVSHRMYAAGHPPLPGFEPATFSNQMPRHWDYPREKPPEVLKIQGLSKSELEQTKLVLVGAAVSLARSTSLLSAQAKQAEADNDVLDLSNFDCYACHHDLKAPSWRQKRGYTGKPGRLPMRPWSTELIKLAILSLDDGAGAKKLQAELDSKLDALYKAFSARPYGDTKEIATHAAEVSKWASDLAGKLDKKGCTKQDADRLYPLIPKLYSTGGNDKKQILLDYDSARQVAWSFEVIYDEDYGYDGGSPAVRGTMKELSKELKLRLPSAPNIIDSDLTNILLTASKYDPYRFRTLLDKLSSEIGKRP